MLNFAVMSKNRLRLIIIIICVSMVCAAPRVARAQCSICTRTAQQLGERPAKALNRGIIYLAVAPLAIFGFLGYRWWKNESNDESHD
jgi:hypothetical protein